MEWTGFYSVVQGLSAVTYCIQDIIVHRCQLVLHFDWHKFYPQVMRLPLAPNTIHLILQTLHLEQILSILPPADPLLLLNIPATSLAHQTSQDIDPEIRDCSRQQQRNIAT